MTSKCRVLNDSRVEKLTEVSCSLWGESGYEVELKRGYSFDPLADSRCSFEPTLKDVWVTLDLAETFDGPYED